MTTLIWNVNVHAITEFYIEEVIMVYRNPSFGFSPDIHRFIIFDYHYYFFCIFIPRSPSLSPIVNSLPLNNYGHYSLWIWFSFSRCPHQEYLVNQVIFAFGDIWRQRVSTEASRTAHSYYNPMNFFSIETLYCIRLPTSRANAACARRKHTCCIGYISELFTSYFE